VFGRGDTLVVADASEPVAGEPLFVKLVEQGRNVYREAFEEQAERADRTWDGYARWELSPTIGAYMKRFNEMRQQEIAAAQVRMRP